MMSGGSRTPHKVSRAQALQQEIDALRRWQADTSELGIPNFGELGDRLQRLREQLPLYFRQQSEEPSAAGSLASRPIADRQRMLDRQQLLYQELDDLIVQLRASYRDILPWTEAGRQMEKLLQEFSQDISESRPTPATQGMPPRPE